LVGGGWGVGFGGDLCFWVLVLSGFGWLAHQLWCVWWWRWVWLFFWVWGGVVGGGCGVCFWGVWLDSCPLFFSRRRRKIMTAAASVRKGAPPCRRHREGTARRRPISQTKKGTKEDLRFFKRVALRTRGENQYESSSKNRRKKSDRIEKISLRRRCLSNQRRMQNYREPKPSQLGGTKRQLKIKTFLHGRNEIVVTVRSYLEKGEKTPREEGTRQAESGVHRVRKLAGGGVENWGQGAKIFFYERRKRV